MRLVLPALRDGLYKPMTYICAKMFDEMLMLSVVSVILAAAVFYAVQLSGSFVLFWLVYYFTLGNGGGGWWCESSLLFHPRG